MVSVHLWASLVAQLVRIHLQCRKPQFNSWIGKIPGERTGYSVQDSWASLEAQMVKNLPVMQETWVPFLGWEYPLEEGMVTHTSILAWRIPMNREAWGVPSTGLQRVRYDWATKHSTQCTSIALGYILCCPLMNMKPGFGKETNYKASLLSLTWEFETLSSQKKKLNSAKLYLEMIKSFDISEIHRY